MVLFVFVVMMLDLGARSVQSERSLLKPGMWVGPSILAAALIAEVVVLLARVPEQPPVEAEVSPREVSAALMGPYLIGVELASILLMAGLVGAYHLGWRGKDKAQESRDGYDSGTARTSSRRDTVLVGSGRSAGAP